MIYNDLLVSITDPQGNPLEEFKQTSVAENSVECWVSSNEGSGFQIHWQPIRNFKTGLGLDCSIKLDGKKVSHGSLEPNSISRGLPGKNTGMTVAKGIKRYYVFGRHNTTDRDDLASPDNTGRELMATIQVTLAWVKYRRSRPRRRSYRTLEEPGFVHERAVKKGHLDVATLGAPVHKRCSTSKRYVRDRVDAGFPNVVFLFRYGPRGWLEAKDIITTERPLVTQDSKPKSAIGSAKKEREATTTRSIAETLRSSSSTTRRGQDGRQPDVIDIDELDSDSDSDVIVLNDPVESKGPTNTIKAET
ncbi:unnamed protein product [Rhizoctonia solani]|uniref:DUF7918 domain-containing protein n=1 Tax=Rhizoctonia solani TaxID=456999 RepID=A0A8H3GSV1_9AGAM|nr:unnamed protein product [Rhizoctonia solani]